MWYIQQDHTGRQKLEEEKERQFEAMYSRASARKQQLSAQFIQTAELLHSFGAALQQQAKQFLDAGDKHAAQYIHTLKQNLPPHMHNNVAVQPNQKQPGQEESKTNDTGKERFLQRDCRCCVYAAQFGAALHWTPCSLHACLLVLCHVLRFPQTNLTAHH